MKQNASFIYSLILLLLMILMFGSSFIFELNVYQKINEENEVIDNTHLPYAYISQKLRNAESIDYKDDRLIFTNDDHSTYIYLYDSFLCEITVLNDSSFKQKDGERICRLDKFDIYMENDVLNIRYEIENTEKEIFFSLRSNNDE